MKNRLAYIFNAFFILIFGYLLCISIFKPQEISFNHPSIFIIFSAAALLVLIGIYQLFTKLNKKGDGVITIFLVSLIILTQIYLLFSLQMDSFADAFVIKGEALKMLANGGHATVQDYFLMYPNNVFITIIRYWLYSFGGTLGITNTYLIESAFLFVCMNITIFALFWIVRKENGNKFGNIYLLIVLFCVPLLGYIWYFYTDTLVLPFAALIALFYYLYTKNNKWWYFIIIGLLFAIGYQIKPNIIILLPAMLIHLCFIRNWRKIILNAVVLMVCFFGLNTAFTPIAESYGFEKDPTVEFPQTHWLMMGLGDPAGRYNRDDVTYTSEFKTKKEKEEANIEKIKERIDEHGPLGLLKLFDNKVLNTWTDGTRAYTWYINSALDYPAPYDYFFGDKRVVTELPAQMFHIINLFLICLGALRFYKKKEFDMSFFVNIALVGVWLFHLFWEANQRYIMFITPLMILSSIYGFKFIVESLYTKKFDLKKGLRKGFLIVSFCVFLLSTVIFAYIGNTVTGQTQDINKYLVKQSYAHIQLAVNSQQIVKQTFNVSDPFNSIQLAILKAPDADSKYQIKVINKTNKKEVYDEVIEGSEFEESQNYQINVNEKPKGKTEYVIEVYQVENKNPKEPLMLGTYISDIVDLYPYGALYIKGKAREKQDIGFSVSNVTSEPIIPKYVSIIFDIGVIIIFAGTYYVFRRKAEDNG
ncbi:glycosyltransferase family 39 protein [Listeria marthii]|uniref:glycosyltransferase family 39 protein n=1 Tax=Listeria marthii TaxID=529731 RepID=UPI00165D318A|nr:glycosyltransferase family 39 protein [Listeria marthii]MBF2348408.1 glycosyltransferase family 39 protein [Listeria marthii]